MLRAQARDLFLQHNPYPGDALENHCLRIAEFTMALAQTRDIPLDKDLVFAAAYLHDFGLLIKNRRVPLYLERGWRFVEPFASHWELDAEQYRELRDMLLYNHSLTPLPDLTPAGDLMRRAAQVEHSFGRWHHGLDQSTRERIFRTYPRLDLTRILVDFARITFLEDGIRTLKPMFFPVLRNAEPG